MSPVQATDATPFVVRNAATHSGIALGEAALALDPLSSSGVQKAIQTALAGAIVANTLLERPASADAAMDFYRTNLEDASVRHRHWAAGYYGEASRTRPWAFWRRRAGSEGADVPRLRRSHADAASMVSQHVTLSRDLAIVDMPCIDGEFVTMSKALRHPRLPGPVAFLGNEPLVPLLNEIAAGATLAEIARRWSDRMPFKSALSIALWLRNNDILVARAEARP
jgi:hypothetical protein